MTVGVVATLFRWSWRPRICGFRVSCHSQQAAQPALTVRWCTATNNLITLSHPSLCYAVEHDAGCAKTTHAILLSVHVSGNVGYRTGTLRDELCGMQDDVHIPMARRCMSTVYTYVSIRCTLSLISARLTLDLWICL